MSVDLSNPLVRVVKYRPYSQPLPGEKVRWRKKERGRERMEGNQGYEKWTRRVGGEGNLDPSLIDSNRVEFK